MCLTYDMAVDDLHVAWQTLSSRERCTKDNNDVDDADDMNSGVNAFTSVASNLPPVRLRSC